MKYVCRICLNEITDLNFVPIKTDELAQIKIQLSICVPEMDVDLVKDPVYCKSCVSALHYAYNFKNQCLQTEEHILNYSRKILSIKSIDINDLLYDLQQSTTNSIMVLGEDVTVKQNMNLLLSHENRLNKQNMNTKSHTDQLSVTFPIDAANKINNANNVSANGFSKPAMKTTADELNTLLDDPLRITPIQSRVFKQEGENEDITIKEEDIALPKVEPSSYEGYEDNLYENAESEDHAADVKNINNISPIFKANLAAENCTVKLTRLSDDIMCKYNSLIDDAIPNTSNRALVFKHEGEDESRSIATEQENRTKHQRVLEKQQKHHYSKKRFSCASCKFQTNFSQSLKLHLRTHTGEKPFACNVCNFRFPNKSGLENHLRIHSGEKPFVCNVCNFRSAQKATLQVHLRIHSGEKPFACEVCSYRSAYKSDLQKHLQHHSGAKAFSCNLCTYRTALKSSLELHLRIHSGEKPFSCNVCAYRSAQQAHLQEHLRIHTGEKPFACNVCTFRSAHKSSLKDHLRIHASEKPFACNVCTYRAAQKQNLNRHLRVHTGEKPFACNVCNFRSTKQSCLRQHIQTHTGGKVFFCNICNSTFSNEATLKFHMKKHENPTLTCNICNYQCRYKQQLEIHIKHHSAGKVYTCLTCNYITPSKVALSRHVKIHL